MCLLLIKGFLHVLVNIPLSDVSLANIFSQSMACLVIHLTVSFAEQKFLLLLKFSLSILSFLDHALNRYFLKLCQSFKVFLAGELV